MSAITFNPPVGQSVHLRVPCASEVAVRPAVLLFTAELSRYYNECLVRDGGRVQLWTDEGCTNGGWRASDFVDSSRDHSGVVALHPPSATEDGKPKVLYLELLVRSFKKVQFTYRILYPSGAIDWLGQYEQNGSITFEEIESLSIDGLDTTDGWAFSDSRQRYGFDNIHAERLEVLKLRAMADFQILALAKQGFLPNLEKAQLLFFIPRVQQSMSIRPTYTMSSSPGLSMTVLASGVISVSGSGTLVLSAYNFQCDPSHFIQDHIQICGLNAWNVITSNEGASITLAQDTDAAVIPLWPSKRLQIFRAPMMKLFQTVKGRNITKLVVLSLYNQRLYLFDYDRQADLNQDIVLQFDPAHNQLKFSHLYQLKAFESPSPAPSPLAWKVVVFSPHRVVQYPFAKGDYDTLPTPPPSPLLKPVVHLTESTLSVDATESSTCNLPFEPGISPSGSNKTHDDDLQNPPHSSSVKRADSQTQTLSLLLRLLRHLPTPRTFVITLVKSYFSVLRALIQLFIWIIPFRHMFGSRQIGRVSTSAAKPISQCNPECSESRTTLPRRSQIPELLNGNLSGPDTAVAPPVSEPPLTDQVHVAESVLGSGSISEEMLFIELYHDTEAIRAKDTTAMMAILIPSDTETPWDEVVHPDSPDLSIITKHAIRLVKGFSASESEYPCSISRCEIITESEEQGKFISCYLLSYKLVWDEEQKGKIICLSTPPAVKFGVRMC